MIDWTRMAQPQDDGYDTKILCMLETARTGWQKVAPERGVTLCGGRIAVLLDGPNGIGDAQHATPEQASQEWADNASTYLRQWDAGYYALTEFIDAVQAFWHPTHGSMGGCISGHHMMYRKSDGQVNMTRHIPYITINSLQGFSQGLYHEYAHLRLEALGINIEDHDFRLLRNGPDELYNSSVRFDKKRPMSAVLHGLYAWTMFTQNDYWQYQNGLLTTDQFRGAVAHNLPKIEKGWTEVANYAEWTQDGLEFSDGLEMWCAKVVADCRVALA